MLVAGLVALAAAAVAGWLIAVAIAPDPPPRPAPAAARTRPADGFAGLSRDEAARILSPVPEAPSSFVALPLVSPAEFCKWLGAIGLKGTAFQQGEAPLRGWTCVADMVKPVDGDDASVSSLFVTARGAEEDRLDLIRLKLNLLDPATAPVVKALAKDFLRTMFRGLGATVAEPALAALDGPTDARFTERGVTYDLKREPGPVLRANLIVTFPRTLGTGGEDSFVPPPRGGWGTPRG